MKTLFPDNRKLRNLHRDLGYFFVGLIIAFSISGIAQNHRKQFKPDRYVYDYKKVHTSFHMPDSSVTKEAVAAFSKTEGLEELRQFDIRKDSILVISYKDADATIQLTTGDGEINIWRKRPVLAQMTFLHKNNGNLWWILYSDIFALGLIFIAASGMFLMKGKNSFRKSGWKFALAGLLVPLMVLILLY
jgi:uncharacterized protein